VRLTVVGGSARYCTATRAVLTGAGFMGRHPAHRGITSGEGEEGGRCLRCLACGAGVVFRPTGGWPPVRVTRVRVPLGALNGAQP